MSQAKTRTKVTTLVLIYTLLFTLLDFLRHYSYSQNSNDVAVFDQALWNSLHGHWFFNSIEGMNHFGVHSSPILFLLLPIYALFQSPSTLIVLQCLSCALGCVFIYLIAKEVLDEKAGLFFAALFALYHPLHGVSWDILNELCYVIAPLLMMFYGFQARRFVVMWVGALLAIACKEEIGFVVGFFGILLTFFGTREKQKLLMLQGISMLILGFCWTFFSLDWLIPHVRGGPYQYFSSENRYSVFGSSMKEILWHMMIHPIQVFQTIFTRQKIFYCIELLAPLGFLSLNAPIFLWMAVPTLTANLLSNASMMSMVGARYPAAMIPFIFISAIYGTKKWIEHSSTPEETRRKTMKTQLTCTLLCTLLFNSTPLRLGFKIPKMTPETLLVRKTLATIPTGATVATQPNFTAHLPHGCFVTSLFNDKANFVLLDTNYPQWYRDSKMTPPEILREGFSLQASTNGLYLFCRGKKPLKEN